VSDPLKSTVTNAGVDYSVRAMEKPSDHAPTWIELDF
jgi:exodeoxyribonuclease-3